MNIQIIQNIFGNLTPQNFNPKTMRTKIFLLLCFPLFLFTCKKDDNRQSGDLPSVSNVTVTNINQTGVDFSSSFVQTNVDALIDHGFVYGTNLLPTLTNAETISLGVSTGGGSFSARATSAIETGKTYYVSAFAKTGKNIFYSDPVSFTGLGSAAPTISAVEPKKGIVGDTVIIRGQNFSRLSENNIVRFNSQDANVLSASETVITVRTPSSKGVETVEISVKTAGQTVTDRSFSYLKPDIIDFYPKTGIYLDTVYVKERNYFRKNITPTFIFGDVQASIISAADSVFKMVVPSSKGVEKRQITCSVDEFASTTVENFTYRIPVISKIEPTEGVLGDIIRIIGKDFGHRPSNVKIRFADKDAFMIAATDTVITVISPVMNRGIENATITALVDERTVTATQLFRYQKPIITSFEPQNACGGDSVIIRGQYLLSTSQLSVSFGLYKVENFGKISNDEIRAVIPLSKGVEEVYITVDNNGLTGTSTNVFRYLKPVITGITPDKGFRFDQITINGQNFGKITNNITVFFDGEKAAISEHQPTKIVVNAPIFQGNKLSEIKIVRDGITTISDTKFQYIEPVISDFSPSSGRVDATITINGQYFTNSKNSVKVYCGDSRLNIESCSDNQIIVTIPNTASYAKQPIRVSVDGNEGVSAASFEIISPWTKKAALPIGDRIDVIASTYNNEGYIAWGARYGYTQSDCWKYNPIEDSWQMVTTNFGNSSRYPVCFQIDNLWYIGNDNGFYQVSMESLQWKELANLPQQRMEGTFSFIIDGKAYVCGGNYLNTVWQYNPSTNEWTQKASLPATARGFGIAFSHNGKGYAGWGAYNLNFFKDFFEYDPQVDYWTQKTDFNFLEGIGIRRAISFVANGRIFAGLGIDIGGSTRSTRDIWEYHPDNDTWTHVAIIPNDGGEGAYVFVINNKAYIGGGTFYSVNQDFYEFDPSKL